MLEYNHHHSAICYVFLPLTNKFMYLRPMCIEGFKAVQHALGQQFPNHSICKKMYEFQGSALTVM